MAESQPRKPNRDPLLEVVKALLILSVLLGSDRTVMKTWQAAGLTSIAAVAVLATTFIIR